jgi:hypothetical protein
MGGDLRREPLELLVSPEERLDLEQPMLRQVLEAVRQIAPRVIVGDGEDLVVVALFVSHILVYANQQTVHLPDTNDTVCQPSLLGGCPPHQTILTPRKPPHVGIILLSHQICKSSLQKNSWIILMFIRLFSPFLFIFHCNLSGAKSTDLAPKTDFYSLSSGEFHPDINGFGL